LQTWGEVLSGKLLRSELLPERVVVLPGRLLQIGPQFISWKYHNTNQGHLEVFDAGCLFLIGDRTSA